MEPMPTEVFVLALALLLQALANMQLGTRHTAGAREKPIAPMLKGVAGTLYRAFNNHFEALILFTGAVIVVTLSQQSSQLTQASAWVYLVARIAYVPAYLSGVLYLRSAVWAVGFFATITMV